MGVGIGRDTKGIKMGANVTMNETVRETVVGHEAQSHGSWM